MLNSLLSKESRSLFKSVKKTWLPRLRHILFSILLAALASSIFSTYLGYWFDFQVLRSLFLIRGSQAAAPEAILVGVDDTAYVETNTPREKTLPRAIIATALEKIAEAKPMLLVNDFKISKETGIADEADKRIAEVLRTTPSTLWSGRSRRESGDVVLPSAEMFRSAASLEIDMGLIEVLGVVSVINSGWGKSVFDRIALARPLVELAHQKIGTPERNAFINFYEGKLRRGQT